MGLIRKPCHHLEAQSANQETPVLLGEGGVSPSEGNLLCFGAFYKSRGKKGTF